MWNLRPPFILAASSIVFVSSHAVMRTPVPRKVGSFKAEVCGQTITDKMEGDVAGPIEAYLTYIDDTTTEDCELYLCRGYTYEDNADNVYSYKAGEVVPFHIELIAGHRPGYANVSVIDLATNTAIGEPLVLWTLGHWPDSTSGPPRNDTDFNATIPAGLEATCDVGGKCAIQWYWYAQKNEQTYESCIDFVVES